MASKKKDRNPVIQKNIDIGAQDAELDDAFLFSCFVDNPALSVATDLENNKTLLVGRTGSGKTAILRKIESSFSDRCSIISLPDMALSYITNSDNINFLMHLNVDLELFFTALWKHVICLEYIRANYNITNKENSRGLLERFRDAFKRDDRRKKGIEYLQRWESKFWVTMDENIREITQQVEEKINAEFGADIEKLKTNVGYVKGMSAIRRQQYEFRAKQIVNSDLLVELSNVIETLSSFEQQGGNQRIRYILIDKIDEKWVDDKIKYQLIQSLVEALKSIRKIRSLKVVVAMRSDVLSKVISESKNPGLQRDKYDDHIVQLSWTEKELFELVSRRVNTLYRKRYTKDNVSFYDIFSSKVTAKDPFDYIVERTLLRPRDVISFVNRCLISAQGRADISSSDVKNAEGEYSRIRLEALIQEWSVSFPWLGRALRAMNLEKARFSIADVSPNIMGEIALEIASDEASKDGDIYSIAKDCIDSNSSRNLSKLCCELMAIFYRIGAVGLKLSPNERYRYSYIDDPAISPSVLGLDTKVHVHPMLHRALGINEDSRFAKSDELNSVSSKITG